MPGKVIPHRYDRTRLIQNILACCVPCFADLAGSKKVLQENGPHNAITMLPTRTGVFLFCATWYSKSAVCISIYCIIVIFLDSNSAQTGHPIPLEGI